MLTDPWLLYGANGYTGALIAEEAVRRGLTPVLAGRREDAIRPLAEKLGLSYRVFDVGAPDFSGVSAVLHCAGPFSHTSKPVVDACLKAGIHYLDITGEIAVFEAVHRRDAEARAKGVVLIPGVGFDVVPSDCLAASLHQRLPDADHLELAFASLGKTSRGTAKTMIEGMPHGGAIRENGRIKKVPLAYLVKEIPFRDQPRMAMSIPWGDVSTAYYSTKIPNIVVYMAVPPKLIRSAKLLRPFTRFLGLGPVQRFLKSRVERKPAGPSEKARETTRSYLWGRVTAPGGREVTGTLETPEGYKLTVLTALACLERLFAPDAKLEPGAQTPSMAFGASLITKIEGCDLRIDESAKE